METKDPMSYKPCTDWVKDSAVAAPDGFVRYSAWDLDTTPEHGPLPETHPACDAAFGRDGHMLAARGIVRQDIAVKLGFACAQCGHALVMDAKFS